MRKQATKDEYSKHRRAPFTNKNPCQENHASADLAALARLSLLADGGYGSQTQSAPGPSPIRLLYSAAFQKIADTWQVVIGIRAPNPLGETLLKEGFPSKNFHMKAKSSSTGPTAGFIAEDAHYSKVKESARTVQANAIASARIKGANAVDLVLTASRIAELIELGHLSAESEPAYYQAHYPGGLQRFFISQAGAVMTADSKPVRVMTNPPQTSGNEGAILDRPITADYDLFAIIPRANRSDNVRELTTPPRLLAQSGKTKALSGSSKKLLERKHVFDFLQKKNFRGEGEDKDTGNLHRYGKSIVAALNHELTRQDNPDAYAGGQLIWHNDETGNPFSPGFDPADKPIFFIPNEAPVQFSSAEEIRRFYSKLKEKDFTPEYSPVFGW